MVDVRRRQAAARLHQRRQCPVG